MVKNKNKSSKPVIEIKEMHKWFGTFHVLKNISLGVNQGERIVICCLLYTSPSPRDGLLSRMPSSA